MKDYKFKDKRYQLIEGDLHLLTYQAAVPVAVNISGGSKTALEVILLRLLLQELGLEEP